MILGTGLLHEPRRRQVDAARALHEGVGPGHLDGGELDQLEAQQLQAFSVKPGVLQRQPGRASQGGQELLVLLRVWLA